MGRFTDAYRILVGRTDGQIRQAAQLVRIEAEWLGICRSIEHTLQDLNLAHDKLRKREERAVKRVTAATPAEPVVSSAAAPSPKEALRARLRAEGKMGVPPGRGRGANGHPVEPQAE